MDEWSKCTIGDMARLKSGFAFKSSQWRDQGIPVVKIGNVKQGSLDLSGCSYVSCADARSSGFELSKGDILIGLTGYVGQVAKVRNEGRLVLNQRVGKFFPLKGCCAEFLFFLVGNESFRSRVEAIAHGSAQPNVSPSAIERLEVVVPSLPEQEAIAEVFAALDDKIELNRRMNVTLEGMAQAIFRDWFVDFGPTRRKAAGEADPVAIMGGLTPNPARAAELAALFPDAFGNDGLPVGWSEHPLDSIAEFLNGLALQKHPAKPGEPDLPVIKIAELRNGLSDRTNRAARTLPAKYIIKNGDFIFSWSGSLMAKVWTEGEGALNQHLFKVSSDAYPQWFYALWVQHHLPEFQLIAASKATTMGHIQRMHLTNAATVCPPDPTIEAMSAVMQPLWDRMIHSELENRTLAETRDYLLPRLMSGTVRVTPKAEAA